MRPQALSFESSLSLWFLSPHPDATQGPAKNGFIGTKRALKTNITPGLPKILGALC